MAKDLIYKRDGEFQYSGDIEPYIVQTGTEIEDIPESDNAQAAISLYGGMKIKIRLPGEDWTEV